jgi:hypothetical protein
MKWLTIWCIARIAQLLIGLKGSSPATSATSRVHAMFWNIWQPTGTGAAKAPRHTNQSRLVTKKQFIIDSSRYALDVKRTTAIVFENITSDEAGFVENSSRVFYIKMIIKCGDEWVQSFCLLLNRI